MEAVAATAAVLPILGLAFNSVKTAYELVSAIKDGSREVRGLAGDLSQLQSILGNLSELGIVQDARDNDGLQQLAKSCYADVQTFEGKLVGLVVRDGDKFVRRIGQKVKGIFGEKELRFMRDAVARHALYLGLQLQLLQLKQQMTTPSSQAGSGAHLQPQLPAAVTPLPVLQGAGNNDPSSPMHLDIENAFGYTASNDPALQESIAYLQRMANKEAEVMSAEAVPKLVQSWQTLLDAAMRREAEVAQEKRGYRELEVVREADEEEVSAELKKARDMLGSSPAIAVNENGKRCGLSMAFTSPTATNDLVGPARLDTKLSKVLRLEQQRKRRDIKLIGGVLRVTCNNTRHIHALSSSRQPGRVNLDRMASEFRVQVMYAPNDSSSWVRISLHQQQHLQRQFSSIAPHFSVIPVVHHSNRVFQIAASGTVQQLMGILESGQANLRVHDHFGWSLLHHSTGNPEMLKFLIENGLDLDEIATNYITGSEVTPLSGHLSAIRPVFESYKACVHALLEAGADPTIQMRTAWSPRGAISFVEQVASMPSSKTTDMLHDVLQRSEVFLPRAMANLTMNEASDESKLNMFLQACAPIMDLTSFMESSSSKLSAEIHIERLKMLLRRGYAITDTDTDGANCLHQGFKYINCFNHGPAYQPEWQDVLLFLVKQGADVFAVDRHGLSVSDYAYSREFCSTIHPLSVVGDLWDCVLTRCGYDIRQFRIRHPRRACYSRYLGYRRGDFEYLWDGWEGKCPYFDLDAELWPSPNELQDQPSSPRYLQEKICLCADCKDLRKRTFARR